MPDPVSGAERKSTGWRSLRHLLTRSRPLRKIRARLPYRLDNWRTRVADYWGWEEGRPDAVQRNSCGPSATPEWIENTSESLVWQLDPRPGEVCLNLGCGIGRVEKFLAPAVGAIHSVDFAESMLRTARERLAGVANVHFYRNDGESLAMFPEGMFDLAWAEMVFHHIPLEITARYLREVTRVLKPGGRFICQLPRKEFYELNSRDICGWLTDREAEQLMATHFVRVQITQNERHIVARGFKAS